MEHDDQEKASSWFDVTSSARGFLRGVTVLTGAGLLYYALGALYKHQDTGAGLLGVGSITLLMVLFALCHAITPAEVSELNARTTARGVMRWLALGSSLGYGACALFAGFWLQNFALAQWCNAASVGNLVVFAVIYRTYCYVVKSDKVASKRSISRYGTGRSTMLTVTGFSALGFFLVGLSANNGQRMLESIAMVVATTCVFAIAHAFFANTLHIDDDRG